MTRHNVTVSHPHHPVSETRRRHRPEPEVVSVRHGHHSPASPNNPWCSDRSDNWSLATGHPPEVCATQPNPTRDRNTKQALNANIYNSPFKLTWKKIFFQTCISVSWYWHIVAVSHSHLIIPALDVRRLTGERRVQCHVLWPPAPTPQYSCVTIITRGKTKITGRIFLESICREKKK